MMLPKFVHVKFYPGYSYGNPERSAAGWYEALGEDGKVYTFVMDGLQGWEVSGEGQYEPAQQQGEP